MICSLVFLFFFVLFCSFSFFSVLSCSFLFLSVLFCPFLSLSVLFCPFLFFYVLLCSDFGWTAGEQRLWSQLSDDQHLVTSQLCLQGELVIIRHLLGHQHGETGDPPPNGSVAWVLHPPAWLPVLHWKLCPNWWEVINGYSDDEKSMTLMKSAACEGGRERYTRSTADSPLKSKSYQIQSTNKAFPGLDFRNLLIFVECWCFGNVDWEQMFQLRGEAWRGLQALSWSQEKLPFDLTSLWINDELCVCLWSKMERPVIPFGSILLTDPPSYLFDIWFGWYVLGKRVDWVYRWGCLL